MIDEEQLRRLSPRERLDLMRRLVAMDAPDPISIAEGGARRRAFALALIVVCCVVLVAWIGVLAATLPRYYRTGGWRGAWVGFDVGLLAAFAATGWASWKRRQMLIICLIVLATLLCCDAWFDVVLDARTPGFYWSLASALAIELPLAALAIAGARRLLRMTSRAVWLHQGNAGPTPRLRHMRLVGTSAGRPLHDLLADPEPGAAAGSGATRGPTGRVS
jgi:peptidoglycan/LPS O-acetylase OafA/YrhL